MFDIGWSEMAVAALIALIVIGPKELPQAMRMAAKWVRKARGLAREFQSGVDEMIREAELEDARKAVDTARHVNIDKALESTVDPTGSVREEQRALEGAAKSGTSVAEATPGKGPTDGGTVSANETAANETAARSGGAAADSKDTETERATVVSQPVSIAPPHSVVPPAEDAAPSPDKTAESEPAAATKGTSTAEASGKRAERT